MSEELAKYLERSLKHLEQVSEKIKKSMGYTEEVEIYQILREMILEQKKDANPRNSNSQIG